MRKESECEFCELCREFYEGKKKECKGPEHCKDYNAAGKHWRRMLFLKVWSAKPKRT